MTGPPSLAHLTQNLFHSIGPSFNRPTDWSRQIRFEPGAIIGYEQRRRLVAYDAGRLGVDLLPSVSLKAGNVETSAGAGVETRIGVNLPHPWLPQSVPFSMTLTASASGRAVLRDIFLDGNTVRPAYRVGHNVGVGTGEIGVELRVRALMLAYRVVDHDALVCRRTAVASVGVDGRRRHVRSMIVARIRWSSFGHSRST